MRNAADFVLVLFNVIVFGFLYAVIAVHLVRSVRGKSCSKT